MAVERYVLKFSDDTEREVTRRPAHYVRAESVVGPNPGTMTFVYATLWAADTGGHGKREAFEKWLDTVDDFDPVTEGPGDADPPDPGADGSHD
jgi:hypothetical protein